MFKIWVTYFTVNIPVDFVPGRRQFAEWVSHEIARKDTALTRARKIVSQGLEIEHEGKTVLIPPHRIWEVTIKKAPKEELL